RSWLSLRRPDGSGPREEGPASSLTTEMALNGRDEGCLRALVGPGQGDATLCGEHFELCDRHLFEGELRTGVLRRLRPRRLELDVAPGRQLLHALQACRLVRRAVWVVAVRPPIDERTHHSTPEHRSSSLPD